MSKADESKPSEFIKFRGALYRVALQAIRGPGNIVPTPAPSRLRTPHPVQPRMDPGQVQVRQSLKTEILSDLDALLQHLAESPVGPSDLRSKFDKFSSGVSVLTDPVQMPLESGLKGIVLSFQKLLKAKKMLSDLKF